MRIFNPYLDNDSLYLIVDSLHLFPLFACFVLVAGKAGGFWFQGDEGRQGENGLRGFVQSGIPVGGQLVSLGALCVFYSLIFDWREMAEAYVADPSLIRAQFHLQAKSLGLVAWEIQDMMDMKFEEFDPSLYTPEQWEFLQRTYLEYPRERRAADVLSYGITPPGRGFWLLLCVVIGLTGGILRRTLLVLTASSNTELE